MSTLPNQLAGPKRFALYTSSEGNYFFHEIRELIAAGLNELGIEARFRNEREGFDNKADWHLVIAPHEFFELGAGRDLARGKLPANLILFNTEQPTSKWRQLCTKHFDRAAIIWDIEFESSLRNRKSGYACSYLPLGYAAKSSMFQEVARLPLHDETRALSTAVRDVSCFAKPFAERPLDVLFLGHLSGRREQYFARHQERFNRLNCFFHKPVVMRPMIPGQTTNMDTTTSVGLAQRSKVLLNIHHGQDCYFEWHRIVLLGIAQRALVITEPCSIAPPFVANVDYVEAPLNELPDRIEYFLKSSAGQNEAQRIVDHGFDTLTNRCRLADVLKPLIEQLTVRPMESEGARFFPATQAGVVAERPLSICVVTPNVTGDGPNAENGSSQIFLAESLAVAGHRVTLLDTAVEPTTGQSLGQRTKDFAARGLNYVALPSNRQAPVESSEACQRSYETYLWLREQAFQVVHFPEAHGIGFYSLLAHRQGLELGETKFCVHAHQPTLWKRQAEQKLVNNISDLELDHMEAECFRLAPALAVTTTAMLRWLERQNFSLPAQRAIRPFAPTTVSRARSGGKPTELVYLGPLSRCPGLTMFCAALERLNPEAARNVKVIFAGNTEGADSQVGDFMPARLQNQKAGWEVVLKKSDDLFEFVQGLGRLIVMPSPMDNAPEFLRRCLSFGLPFLTVQRDDSEELIDTSNHAKCLFPGTPAALATALQAALKDGVTPARFAPNGSARWQEWLKWHGTWAAEENPTPTQKVSTKPLVSVCLVHFNRPGYLKQSLASLRAQDYPNFEVVLVDDGSTQPEALEYLKSLEPEFAQRNWQLVRQENRYLGAARNFGARHARGEYLMFMDDDNFAKPNEISTFVHVATNTGAEILTCAMDVFTGTDAPKTEEKPLKRFVFLGGAAASGAVRNCFGDANGFVRRDTFERIGGFTEDYGITHEDWEFYARATLAGCRIETMPQALFWYRLADQSMNRTTPLYANLQRSLRPYLEAVPAPLRGLIQFALGSACSPNAQSLPIAADQSLGRLHERLIATAQEHIRAGQNDIAEPLLLDILQSAQATRNPAVVVRTLLAVGKMLAENGKGQTAVPILECALTQSKTLNAPLFSKEAETLLALARRGSKAAPPPSRQQTPQSAAAAAKLFQAPIPSRKPLPATKANEALVSIIILAHNQLSDTQRCLESLARHTPEAHELILVDNGSNDGTTKFFQEYAAKNRHVCAIINRDNRGFAGGNNQGLAIARGQYVVLLNNDTVVAPGWLIRQLATLKQHPEAGIVGPMSNRVSGPQLVNNVNYTDLADLPVFAEGWAKAHDGQSVELARAVGFCLLARNEVIKQIGGLDERFGSGNFEDDDFCIRTQLAGFRIRAAQDAFVHHVGGQTFKGAKIDYGASLLRNWKIFKMKWAMPKELLMEKGYQLPTKLPVGVSLRIPLPDLNKSHRLSVDGRVWTDKNSAENKTRAQIQLPNCALLGNLNAARELVKDKQYRAAWLAANAAIDTRPYHPEAYLLLAEIAKAAGHGAVAQKCAQQAKALAPGWKGPGQFLKAGKTSAQPAKELAEMMNCFEIDSKRAPRLSVCLIVRNEEKFLGQCLASIRDVAAQIVVLDTGSTDRTIAIAKEHGAEVYHFAWSDDFSAARNAALERATGDWVLSIDADEELLPEHKEMLRRETQVAEAMAFRLPIIDKGREQAGCSYVPRLFRNAPGLFFLGRVHEQVFSSVQVRCQQWGLKHSTGKSALLHHGYTEEMMADRNKIERNLRLLERAIEELPDEPNLLMNYGLELVRSGQLQDGLDQYMEALRCASAKPASEITPELRETLLTQVTTHLLTAKLFEEIVKVWQTPFAKSSNRTASQHFGLGLAYLELKQPALAAEQFRQCLVKRNLPTFSPRNPEIFKAGPAHCLALCQASLQQSTDAADSFRAAIAADPKARAPRSDFARFLAEDGKPVDALKLLNELISENAADPEVWRMGGQIALSKPEFRSFACDWTGEAIKHFGHEPAIILQRAEALFVAEQIGHALPFWRDARLPKHPRSDAARVLCEILQDDSRLEIAPAEEAATSQEALKWYRRLIAMGAIGAVQQINQKIESVRLTLPSFVTVWETATRKVAEAAAA